MGSYGIYILSVQICEAKTTAIEKDLQIGWECSKYCTGAMGGVLIFLNMYKVWYCQMVRALITGLVFDQGHHPSKALSERELQLSCHSLLHHLAIQQLLKYLKATPSPATGQ